MIILAYRRCIKYAVVCVCVCQGSDGWDGDLEVPAARHSGGTAPRAPPHPHPQVPGQQRHHHVVQNLPVGRHLSPVSSHLSCLLCPQGWGAFWGSVQFSGCEVWIVCAQGLSLCRGKQLVDETSLVLNWPFVTRITIRKRTRPWSDCAESTQGS